MTHQDQDQNQHSKNQHSKTEINTLPCIYIAGPYSGDLHTALTNIRRFHKADYDLTIFGFACYCPGHDFLRSLQGDISPETYKAVSMAWLRKSDAVFVLPGWMESAGTLAEIKEANRLGIPVFFEIDDLMEWKGECWPDLCSLADVNPFLTDLLRSFCGNEQHEPKKS